MASNKDAPGDVLAMKEALKPFADAEYNLSEKALDSASIWETAAANDITHGDLRRAKKVFAAIDRLDVKAEAKSQEPGVVVKPLRWVRSSVFGSYKWRGMSQDFGEVGCFTDVAYSDAQIDEKKAAIQADYEQRIRSALIHPTTKPEAPAKVWRDIQSAIEQAIDCVRGETPEDCSDEEAKADTLSKLREADIAIAALIAEGR